MLAGGKSSRMGRDKALLKLAGKPLVRHAVKKLRRVCMDVRMLSANAGVGSVCADGAGYASGCGPMGGMEAALEHSVIEWNLFMPVDMPFFPSVFLTAGCARRFLEEMGHAVSDVYCGRRTPACAGMLHGTCAVCDIGARARRVQGLCGA